MNQMIIHDEIRIMLPEEFHEMDSEEKKKIYALSDAIPDWSAQDAERHILFSASRKQMNSILAALACSMDGAKGLEKRMRIALRDRNYRFGEYIKEELDGKKAFGFTFRCQGEEGELLNRTMMVRNGGSVYTLTSQVRADREKESEAVLHEIWRSLSWI